MALNKSQVAWVLYDFANSAYYLMIPTILFPLYFRKVIAISFLSPDISWSLAVSVPIIIMGILSPILGAIADLAKKRKLLLIISFCTTVFLSAMLGFINSNNHIWVSLVFMFSMLTFNASLFLYDAFLPIEVEDNKNTAVLSCLGWGIGYLGGIICLGLLYPLIKHAELPAAIKTYQSAFVFIALYYLFFSLPTIFYLKESAGRISPRSKKTHNLTYGGIIQVISTIKRWRENKEIFKFLLGNYLINDGLATMTYFTTIFASETVKMSLNEIMYAFIIVQIVAIPCTIIFGYLAERFGYKRVLLWTIVIWIFIVIGYYSAQTKGHYYILSILVGTVLGSTPAISRALLSQMIEKTQSAEIFGFNAFSSRISSVFGPILFGIIATISGNQRVGVLSLLVFFILGYFVLRQVRVFQNINITD